VSSKFAVSSIQLRFTFMRRLHPFFPPRVEVVRPHLSTPLPGALASYPLLRLEHWHPTLTMTQVVDNLRTFLEVWGCTADMMHCTAGMMHCTVDMMHCTADMMHCTADMMFCWPEKNCG
jgi:hypothetical protein